MPTEADGWEVSMKIGILGAGNIAGTMADTLRQMEQVTCLAVGSRTLQKAQEFAEKFNFEKAYGSYEELVSDPEVQLIYVATPHSHHYEHIKLCLEHGKHVLAEKAFTQNAVQAREVIAMAREKRLLLAEAIWPRYMPMRKTLKDVVDSGVIGSPTSLYAALSFPIAHVERIREPALAGGILLDVGVYPLNFATMVFGDDIEKINATGVLTEKGVDNITTAVLTYRDGRCAIIHSNAQAVSNRQGIIYGEKGYILVDGIINCQGIQVFDADSRLIAEYQRPKQISGYEYEVEACMEAIEKGWVECPQMPHEEIIRIMEYMDEIRRQIGVVYPNEK